MGDQEVVWSREQRCHLQGCLNDFWSQDVWSLSRCPLVRAATSGLRKFRFTCVSAGLKTELKYACWQKFERGDWALTASTTGKYANRVHHLIKWLSTTAPTTQSLLERDSKEWERSFQSYLVSLGKWQEWETTRLNRLQEPYQVIHKDCRLSTLRQIYLLVQDAYDRRDFYERDVWDLSVLGDRLNLSQGARKLSFIGLQQPWLRLAAKQYMRYRLATDRSAVVPTPATTDATPPLARWRLRRLSEHLRSVAEKAWLPNYWVGWARASRSKTASPH